MKKINMEFRQDIKEQGFTTRANINSALVKSLKRWNKQDGKAIAQAIKNGDTKKATYHMSNAKDRNKMLRELSERHDKLVFLNCKLWGIWEADTRKCYKFEY